MAQMCVKTKPPEAESYLALGRPKRAHNLPLLRILQIDQKDRNQKSRTKMKSTRKAITAAVPCSKTNTTVSLVFGFSVLFAVF